MGNYRPITDVWILGRAAYADGVKRYGGYLGGFPERARVLLGASIDTPVLHVCGGKARQYKYKGGFGPNDKTLDNDPSVNPDFLQDVRDPLPLRKQFVRHSDARMSCFDTKWDAMLADPGYSAEDNKKWPNGEGNYPTPHEILTRAAEVLRPGGKIGIIHYLWPAPVKGLSKELAVVAVGSGRNGRARWFVVFEKL